jgi:hypothetical protein
VGLTANDKLRRAGQRANEWERLKAHEKMTLASPFGIAAGRSPSCVVPPIMADEQIVLGIQTLEF